MLRNFAVIASAALLLSACAGSGSGSHRGQVNESVEYSASTMLDDNGMAANREAYLAVLDRLDAACQAQSKAVGKDCAVDGMQIVTEGRTVRGRLRANLQ